MVKARLPDIEMVKMLRKTNVTMLDTFLPHFAIAMMILNILTFIFYLIAYLKDKDAVKEGYYFKSDERKGVGITIFVFQLVAMFLSVYDATQFFGKNWLSSSMMYFFYGFSFLLNLSLISLPAEGLQFDSLSTDNPSTWRFAAFCTGLLYLTCMSGVMTEHMSRMAK